MLTQLPRLKAVVGTDNLGHDRMSDDVLCLQVVKTDFFDIL